MGLIYDDSEFSARELLNVLIGEEELLNGADNDAFLVVQSFCKVAGMLLVVNALQQAGNVLKAVNRVLELAVEYNTVGDNNNGIKDTLVLIVMKRRQPIGDPSNRVGLAGTGRVLDQIVCASTFLAHVCNDLPNHIVLMVAREDQLFLSDSLSDTVLCHFFLFLYVGNEAVKDIQKRVALEDLFPNVVCIIPVFVVGIARATGHTGPVGAHVEGHEVSSIIFELSCHPRLIEVNCEVDQEAVVQPEGKLLRAAVLLKLLHGAPNVLTLELVLQLNRHNGDTVHRKHHINGVCAAG